MANVKRRVFYSFHFDNDFWRTQQVRNIGVIEGDAPVSKNDWESVKRNGDAAIEKWIEDHLAGKSCLVVLVGSETANRRWIKHEIERAWNLGKGVVGIGIHGLKDHNGYQGSPGNNPFSTFTLCDGKMRLDQVVKHYSPTATTSTDAYANIANGIEACIEEAIKIRNEFKCP